MKDTEAIVDLILSGGYSLEEVSSGPRARSGPSPLPFTETSSYDLTVTSAAELSIPVLGTVSGGANRRVVVLERRSYRKNPTSAGVEYVGYAVRLVITVNRMEGNTKLSLPFLAASAEVGNIEGRWTVQVVGMSGPKVDGALVPPSELSVETFVLAKQSLSGLIGAIHDPSTQFDHQVIYLELPADKDLMRSDTAIGVAYGLSCIQRKWRLDKALNEIAGARLAVTDSVGATYQLVAGITMHGVDPTPQAIAEAKRRLDQIRDVNPW